MTLGAFSGGLVDGVNAPTSTRSVLAALSGVRALGAPDAFATSPRNRRLVQLDHGPPDLMTTDKQADPLGLVGKTLSGKYDVEQVVEETALSVVYRAVHRVLQRPMAIKAFKVPRRDEACRAELLDGFVREGALLMELSERSAAVCQAHDVAAFAPERGEPIPYIVLEWLEGEPLEDMVRRERARGTTIRTIEEAMRLIEPVADALSLAHERGIVHRDVKPSNVFVMDDGRRCKLIDFGIAKLVDEVARIDGLQTFTPAYGAPEQFSPDHGTVGPWTDVYALALVLVELLTGQEALRSDDVLTLASLSCDPARRPTPRTMGAHVGPAVEGVFNRALAVCPHHRFPDAREFWAALVRAVALRARSIPPALDTTMRIDLRTGAPAADA
jgi:eukaryotic-like serine/threonine-protein kinase